MGGLDTPENLVEVTVTQHAMFHFCNYQLWGNGEDFIAWRCLSGQITIDEANLEAQLLGAKKGGRINKENGTGIHALTSKQRIEAGKKGAQKCKEIRAGIFGMSSEELSEAARKAGQKHKENKTGIFGMTLEQKIEAGKKGAQKIKESGSGIFGMSSEELSEAGKRGLKTQKENNIGIFGMTLEQRRKNAKKINSQKWQCTVTGYVTNAGALTGYQKKRGIDTSNRIRIQ